MSTSTVVLEQPTCRSRSGIGNVTVTIVGPKAERAPAVETLELNADLPLNLVRNEPTCKQNAEIVGAQI